MYFILGTWLATALIATLDMSYSTEQLSFSGGGAYGAVEIGILKK